LNIDYLLLFPVILATGLVLVILLKAHKELKERWRYKMIFPLYLLYYSLMLAVCWVSAIVKESTGAKKKWS
jgi:hypothetical protein